MLASVVHVLPLAKIRRERRLPVPGKVAVRNGQQVGATDVIAETQVAPQHLLLDIARGLGVPESKVSQYIQCSPGQRVAQGDLLAGPVGLAKRVVRATKSGRVILVVGGQILLELDGPAYELCAGISGTVTALIEDYGAVIETTGALVQGVWGNGRIDYGLMNVLLDSVDDELTKDGLDVSMRGSVVLGGYCGSREVLDVAGGLPIRGLILSSMDPALKPIAQKQSYPVIVLEGFGKIPLNSVAERLLRTSERREVALNAEHWDRLAGQRPEIVIPLPSSGDQSYPQDVVEYEAGQRVRLAGGLHRAGIGTINQISSRTVKLSNGVQAMAAEVLLESGNKVQIPLANLEVLQ